MNKHLSLIYKKLAPNILKLLIIDIRYHLRSDLAFRKFIFKKKFNKELNITSPRTFNEKIAHRTLFQRDPLFTQLSDKIHVRQYVSDKIGEQYLPIHYGYYLNPKDINFDALPDKFVLKCNHDSGSVYIVDDKNKLNIKDVEHHFDFYLKRNFYKITREWQYRDIPPKIICEEFLDIFSNSHCSEPEDYKIHCINGEPKFLEVQFDRFKASRRINVYDTEWVLQPFLMGFKNTDYHVERPKNLEELLYLARKLASNTDYCRVDFYTIKEKIVFGEITFTPCNGLDDFYPKEWDFLFSKEWNISTLDENK